MGYRERVSGVRAASRRVSSGKRRASSNGTQRNRIASSPGPMATRLANITWIPAWSRAQSGKPFPSARSALSRAASSAFLPAASVFGGRGSVQGRGRPGPHRRRQGQAPREGEGRDSVQRKGVELGVGRGAGRDGPHWVRVVVDRADPGDGAGQARVHGHGAAPRAAARRSGTWARLRRDRAGREQESQGEDGRGGDRGARQRERTGPGRASTHGGFLSSSGCRGGRRGCRAPSSWTDSPCSSPPPSPPGRPGPSPARR